MTTPVHASIANDQTFGIGMHKTIYPTAPPIIAPGPSIECPAAMEYVGGKISGKRKIDVNVTINDQGVVLAGHDVGIFLPHLVQPMSPLVSAAVVSSSRKVVFSCSRVLCDNKALAGAQVGSPFLPLVSCSDPVSMPTSVNVSSWRTNVLIGFSEADIAAGITSILVSALISLFFTAAFDAASLRLLGRKLNWNLGETAKEILKTAAGFADPTGVAKLVFVPVVEGALSYARGQIDGTHDWSIKFTVGGTYGNYSVSYAGSDDPTRRGWSFDQVVAGDRRTTYLTDSLREGQRARTDARRQFALNAQRGESR